MSKWVEQFHDEKLRKLYDYWSTKRINRLAPSREDIDPAEIPRLLPNILLTEVIDGGARFRHRLVGSDVEAGVGYKMAGRYLHEFLEQPCLDHLSGLYRKVIESRRPVYSEGTLGGEDSVIRSLHLMLPLSRDGESVDMVLGGRIFRVLSAKHGPSIVLVDDELEYSPSV